MLNRETFFNAIRAAPFGGMLTQPQVDGLTADLDHWVKHYPDGNPQHLAYVLATEYHETEQTMQPVKERGGDEYLRRMYDKTGDRPAKAKELGNINAGDGVTYTGGKIQLTGRDNFRRMGNRLNVPLEEQPALIYDLHISTAVLFAGMIEGKFTGKSLSDYTDIAGNLDPIKARRVVNGNDCAAAIAVIYRQCLKAVEIAYQPSKAMQVNPVIQALSPEPKWHVGQVGNTLETDPIDPEWAEFQAWQDKKRLKAASKPTWQSKILVTSVASIASLFLARYGLDMPPEQLIDIITGLTSGGFTLIGIFRLFFTNKPVRVTA